MTLFGFCDMFTKKSKKNVFWNHNVQGYQQICPHLCQSLDVVSVFIFFFSSTEKYLSILSEMLCNFLCTKLKSQLMLS